MRTHSKSKASWHNFPFKQVWINQFRNSVVIGVMRKNANGQMVFQLYIVDKSSLRTSSHACGCRGLLNNFLCALVLCDQTMFSME